MVLKKGNSIRYKKQKNRWEGFGRLEAKPTKKQFHWYEKHSNDQLHDDWPSSF